MYISIDKLLYPKAEEIKVVPYDIAVLNANDEHFHHVMIGDRAILTLTQEEAATLATKLHFSVEEIERRRDGKTE